jgi:hypothetical protein
MKSANQIGFGIEIECNIPVEYEHEFPAGGYHRGIQIPCMSAGWNTQKDGSVTAPAGFKAVEIVSPILTGEDGLAEVVQMLDLLDQIGARTNPSCGLHVHFSTGFLTNGEYVRMVKLFKHYEMAFYGLNGTMTTNRLNNHYCKQSSRWNGDRYASLNLTNINRGHAEIRVWAGNLKPEIVVSAIYMACALASRATNPEPVKCSDLSGMGFGEIMQAFCSRFLGTEADNNPALIIPDDNPCDLTAMMLEQAGRA